MIDQMQRKKMNKKMERTQVAEQKLTWIINRHMHTHTYTNPLD